MKKIIVGAFILFVLIFSVIYYKSWIFSSLLDQYGFTKNDIVSNDGYSTNSKHLLNVLLLADDEKIAIAGLTNKGLGIWKNRDLEVILVNPENDKFISTGFIKMKPIEGIVYDEKHLFIAGYVNSKKSHISGNSDFYLNVNYYHVNDKILLYAHAIVGNDVNRFGSRDIISYIESQ